MKLFRSLLIFSILQFLCSSCLVGRFVWYNFSNITDYKIFPARQLPKSPEPFHFIETPNPNVSLKMSQYLDSLAAKTPTVALLIIRNDSILYEKYLRNYEASSTVASFSMAKSYISALVGIAISEGSIKSVEDNITDYLPELKNRKGFDKIRICFEIGKGVFANLKNEHLL